MRARVPEPLWTAGFIRDVIAGEGSTVFKRFTGVPQVTRHRAVGPGRRPVAFDFYRTAHRRALPPLIVTHGFAHEGPNDPRLQSLCRRLARLGWAVIVPEFPQMRGYQLGLDDTDDLETVVMMLPSLEEVSRDPAGILAFSFGAGPVLIGLTREGIRRHIGFALVFGGYFDLRHSIRYVLTGAYDIGGLRGRVNMPTERDDRWKFLKGNLRLLPESETRDEFLRIVEARIADPTVWVDPSGCSKEEQGLFALIANRDPSHFETLYAPVAALLDPWISALSPSALAARITTPLVIVHSRTDQKTHFSESIALSRAVTEAPAPLVAIVNTFAHVDVVLRATSLSAFRREVVPGLKSLWQVSRVLVRGARIPSANPECLGEAARARAS